MRTDIDLEWAWLAGLLEGEGSFMAPVPSKPNTPIISLHMTDEDIVARVAAMFELKYMHCKRQKAHHKASFSVQVRGAKAVDAMRRLRPMMGPRRQSQIDRALDGYNPIRLLRLQELNRVLPSNDVLLKLHESLSYRELGRKFGCSHHTIHRRLQTG